MNRKKEKGGGVNRQVLQSGREESEGLLSRTGRKRVREEGRVELK